MKKVLLLTVMLLLSIVTFAQNRSITGSVTDTNGEPLIGVGVVVQGTTTGTMTDADGKFSLIVPDGAILEISSIGYTSQTIPTGEKSTFDIILEEDVELIEGTVVIGYGTVKRTNFTGSVSTYSVGEGPVSNVTKSNALDLLRGMAPGVQLSQSGVAGSTPSIQVRGQRSLGAASNPSISQPLIVLDGVIFKGSINDIDPSTIETMSVMKDATSLAAYGSQAANGVIMITSKKGVIGKPMINFRSSVGLVEQNYTPRLRNAAEYIEMLNDRSDYPKGTTAWMSDVEKANYEAGKETDWVKYMSQTGVQQDYSLSISGGSENMNYLVGASYSDNTNFIKGNEFTRTTVTGRVNTTITKNISAGLNFNFSSTANDGNRPNYGQGFTLSPLGSPYLSDGKTLRKFVVAGVQETATNPLWDVFSGNEREIRGTSVNVGGNVDVKIPWIKGLSYRITGNVTLRNTRNRMFQYENNFVSITDGENYSSEIYDKYLSQANGSVTNTKYTSYVIDNILTYTREIGKHYINATLVYTRDADKIDGLTVEAQGFEGIGNTTLGFYGLNNADVQRISTTSYSLHTDVGYLARVNYSFADKYHLNASFRRDGSSVFGADHKWGNFPAFGAAWTISDEKWFNIKWIDYLKLKASWGKNGNQSLSPYGTLSTLAMGKSGGVVRYFDDSPVYGEQLTRLGNPELGWETTTSWNYGFETDLLNRILHWELDAYTSKTTDQIFPRTILPMGSGLTTQQATMGRVDNWGIESSLRADLIQKKDLKWTTTLNFTMNRNKLVELYGGEEEDDIVNNRFFGKPINPIYGYNWIGIVQESDIEYQNANGALPGDAMFEDIDGDGKITPDDRKILGYNQENFRMSLSSTFTWKDFTIYVMFNGVFGGNGYGMAVNTEAYTSFDGAQYHNVLMHPYWTAENKSATYPRPRYNDSRFTPLQNYGFVRLQDVNISYNLKANWLRKIHLSSAQLYVSGRNLFFIAPHWQFSDPEVRVAASQQLARTYTFGINLRF